jgi:Helix-turn-helix.
LKKKISVSSIEKMTGLSNGSISKWNESSPTVDKLKVVADYLEVSLEELMENKSSGKEKKQNE